MPENRGKISLEELLRSKRDERPNDAFWTRFDRELKAKQRRLLQRQIVDHEHLRSPFAKRFNKFVVASGSLGFAACAIVLSLRFAPEDSNGPSNSSPTSVERSPAAPSFTMAAPDSADGQPAAPALREFSTLSSGPKPRIVVEVLNPSATPTRSVASAEPTPVRASAAALRSIGEYQAEFAANLSQFNTATLEAEAETSIDESMSGFQQVYYLGKYADPLGGDFTANFKAVGNPRNEFGRAETRSLTDLDDFMSSQGNRGDATLDKLTLRF